MAIWANGSVYVADKEVLSVSWRSSARPLYSAYRGKGQLFVPPAAALMWKKTPWTEATHKGSGVRIWPR